MSLKTYLLAIVILCFDLLAMDLSFAEDKTCPKLGIPAYSYPGIEGSFWNNLHSIPKNTILIINPASGPGKKADPNYIKATQHAQKMGLYLIGYIDTNYGKRSIPEVTSDINRFLQLYPGIKGVFLDQAALDANHFDYYKQLSQKLRSKKLSITLNPGQPIIDERYTALGDHIMTFEGPSETYNKTVFPSWQSRYPKTKFWHLIYEVNSEVQYKKVLAQTSTRPAGIFYITDRKMPNPWDKIPQYWQKELQAFTTCK